MTNAPETFSFLSFFDGQENVRAIWASFTETTGCTQNLPAPSWKKTKTKTNPKPKPTHICSCHGTVIHSKCSVYLLLLLVTLDSLRQMDLVGLFFFSPKMFFWYTEIASLEQAATVNVFLFMCPLYGPQPQQAWKKATLGSLQLYIQDPLLHQL